jgi:hypothetical protein
MHLEVCAHTLLLEMYSNRKSIIVLTEVSGVLRSLNLLIACVIRASVNRLGVSSRITHT